jgi:hypothetical protein
MIRNSSTTPNQIISALNRISTFPPKGTGINRSIQRVHNKYHKTAPEDAVNIMRGSPYGNPFKIGSNGMSRDVCIAAFERSTLPQLDLTPLIGKHLLCCCYPKSCHGDSIMVLLRRHEQQLGYFYG